MKHYIFLILLVFVLAGCSSRNLTNAEISQPVDDIHECWEAEDEEKESKEIIPIYNNKIDQEIMDTIRDIKQKYPFFDSDFYGN